MIARARGQATVEMSLLMIVILPIFFYTLFLDDLLRHRLDLMEAVVSSAWDFTTIDQQKNKGANLSKVERLTWCDHTAVYNSYDNNFECQNPEHHKEFTAHICWVVGDAQQIQCSTDSGGGNIDSKASDFNGGGITSCSAKVGVLNYFLPNNLFPQFAKEKLTTKEHMSVAQDEEIDAENGTSLGLHNHFGSGTENVFMLEKQTFAVLHDTWAMNDVADIDAMMDIMPSFGTGDFKGRVKKYYPDSNKFQDAKDFFKKIKDDKLIKDGADNDAMMMGDDPSTLHMSYNAEFDHGFGMITKHSSSASSDQRVKDTHSNRVNSYMGVDENTW